MCYYYKRLLLCEFKNDHERQVVDKGWCCGLMCIARIMPASYYLQYRFPRLFVFLLILSIFDLILVITAKDNYDSAQIILHVLIVVSSIISLSCCYLIVELIYAENQPYSSLSILTSNVALFGTAVSLTYVIYLSVLSAEGDVSTGLGIHVLYANFFIFLSLWYCVSYFNVQLEREQMEQDFVAPNQEILATQLRNPLLTQQSNHTNANTTQPIEYKGALVQDKEVPVVAGGFHDVEGGVTTFAMPVNDSSAAVIDSFKELNRVHTTGSEVELP